MIFAVFALYVCTQLLSVKRSLIETAAFLLQGLAVVSMSTELLQGMFRRTVSCRRVTMGKVADIFALVSRGRRRDRIPLRRSPRRAHGTLQPVWMKVL